MTEKEILDTALKQSAADHGCAPEDFFRGPCPEKAEKLVGKLLCRRFPDGTVKKLRILETEAYCGEEDTASRGVWVFNAP